MWCRRLAKEDAEKITIPHILLASNGEDAEVVKEYKAIIEGDGKPGVVRILYPFLQLHSSTPERANILRAGGDLCYHASWMDGRQG
jgi:hypothetical protein